MISPDGQTDSSGDDIIIEDHEDGHVGVVKSIVGDMDGETLMRNSRMRRSDGVEQEGEPLPILV